MSTGEEQLGAVVLAGGLARRMGGNDKGLITLAGRSMVQHVIDALRPAVSAMVINANRHAARYAEHGLPVVADTHADHQGPLAGLAAGCAALETNLVFMCPCDSPFVTVSLVERLRRGLGDADIAVAHDGERLQPVFAVVRRSRAESLDAFLASGERKIDRWYASERCVEVDASAESQAFRNINTPEDLAEAESLIRSQEGLQT